MTNALEMKTYAEISFAKKNYDDGFGFTCMKAAYQFGITGRMDYSPELGVKIQAEGEQADIEDFMLWIKSNNDNTIKFEFAKHLNSGTKFKEFDIFRHST